jgi:hypothetical protein
VSGLLITGVAPIVNVCAFDVPPPGVGFTTVMEAVPPVAIRDAGTVAVSCVEETNVVVSAVAFHFTVEVETKFVPLTVKVNCGLPAVAQVGLIAVVVGTGLLMVNVTAFDVPPPGAGFTTVTEAVPVFATRAAVTVAVSCVEETNVVARAVPFQLTVEQELEAVPTKPVPFTVKVNPPLPAIVDVGLIEVIAGTGSLTVNVCAPDVPPFGPLGFFTVTCGVPPQATFAAGTVALSWVEETNVVARAVPFQFTVAPDTKLLPFAVKVNVAAPAVHKFGLIELRTGPAASALLVAANTTRNGRIFFIEKS